MDNISEIEMYGMVKEGKRKLKEQKRLEKEKDLAKEEQERVEWWNEH